VTVAGGGRPPTATDKHQPRRAELGEIGMPTARRRLVQMIATPQTAPVTGMLPQLCNVEKNMLRPTWLDG